MGRWVPRAEHVPEAGKTAICAADRGGTEDMVWITVC